MVDIFLAHHSYENIMKDILAGIVYLILDREGAIGTVTIKENEICRLFVVPNDQHKGFGRQLLNFVENMIAEEYMEIYLDSSLPTKSTYLKRGYVVVESHKIIAGNGDVLCHGK
ncbi:MAG: GNAT family N-acetyltransferase [Lachnospiraceae bacterium]